MSPLSLLLLHSLAHLPGDAFGSDLAGGQPTPQEVAESDVAKALRTAGFPEVEAKIIPENVTNKVLSGIQKRLLKMDDTLKKLADHPESTLINKILLLCKVYCFPL